VSPRIAIVAAARVVEARLRGSPAVTRVARAAVARMARASREVRALVRLRLMRLV
jgi:hypothetical protein